MAPPQTKTDLSVTIVGDSFPRLDVAEGPQAARDRKGAQLELSFNLDDLQEANWTDGFMPAGAPARKPEIDVNFRLQNELGRIGVSRDQVSIDLTQIPMKVTYDDDKRMLHVSASGKLDADTIWDARAGYSTFEDELKRLDLQLNGREVTAGLGLDDRGETFFLRHEDSDKRYSYGVSYRHLDGRDDALTMDFRRQNAEVTFTLSPDGKTWELAGSFQLSAGLETYLTASELERACGLAFTSKQGAVTFGLECSQGTRGSEVDFTGFLRANLLSR